MTSLLSFNIDLILTGIAASGMAVLGFTALISDPHSITTKSFFLFTMTGLIWSMLNYTFYHVADPTIALTIMRVVIFMAVWFVLFLFQFFYAFPNGDFIFPKWYRFLAIPVAAAVSAITLTPLVFVRVSALASDGTIIGIENGPGIFLFVATVTALIFGGLLLFIHKMQHAPRESQPMYKPVLWGIFTTFVLIIAFNLILPAFFNNSQFIRYSALFIFPTVVSAAYAIRIRHLFNVKVFSTALLVFLLAIVSFGEIIFSGTFSLILFHSGVFILVLVFGINLIRSVLREVEQREKLEVANRGQENLIHIMNHQIKGYLGTARSIFAELVGSNDYGQMPEASKPLLAKGLEEMGEGVDYVQAILKGASAQSGALPYDMKPVDLKSLISNLAAEQKEVAEKAGLSFESNIADGDYAITGDATMLEEAFKNLITNAIKYNNPNGSIAVTLSRTDGKILFSVKDSGKGISKDDEPRLFKPGGVGKDSTHYNVEASGFGLAFVKPVIEKHQGRVWFKSNSPDKGTTFFVELPFTS